MPAGKRAVEHQNWFKLLSEMIEQLFDKSSFLKKETAKTSKDEFLWDKVADKIGTNAR